MPDELNVVCATSHREPACDKSIFGQIFRRYRHTVELDYFTLVSRAIIESIDIKNPEIVIRYLHFVGNFIRQFFNKTYGIAVCVQSYIISVLIDKFKTPLIACHFGRFFASVHNNYAGRADYILKFLTHIIEIHLKRRRVDYCENLLNDDVRRKFNFIPVPHSVFFDKKRVRLVYPDKVVYLFNGKIFGGIKRVINCV